MSQGKGLGWVGTPLHTLNLDFQHVHMAGTLKTSSRLDWHKTGPVHTHQQKPVHVLFIDQALELYEPCSSQ